MSDVGQLEDELTVTDILNELATAVDSSQGITKFNISRGHVWDGARRAVLRKNFKPHSVISVKFTDDIGQSEGAVDQGGSRREFLQLLVDHLTNESPVFKGPDTSKQLSFIHDGKYITVQCPVSAISVHHKCT